MGPAYRLSSRRLALDTPWARRSSSSQYALGASKKKVVCSLPNATPTRFLVPLIGLALDRGVTLVICHLAHLPSLDVNNRAYNIPTLLIIDLVRSPRRMHLIEEKNGA